MPTLVEEYEGRMYGHLKGDLAELVVTTLTPYCEKYEDLMKYQDYLRQLMLASAEKATARALVTLADVYGKTGLLPR